MLASTIQFTNTPRPPGRHTPPPTPHHPKDPTRSKDPGRETGMTGNARTARDNNHPRPPNGGPGAPRHPRTPGAHQGHHSTARRRRRPRHPQAGGRGRACSLRTQQRADPPWPAGAPPSSRQGKTPDKPGDVFTTFPPMSEPRPTHSARQAATGPAPHPLRAARPDEAP
jgi:hypothetical protein